MHSTGCVKVLDISGLSGNEFMPPATTIEVLYLFFSYQNDFHYMLIIEERILPFAADVELGLTSILVKVDTFFYFILL